MVDVSVVMPVYNAELYLEEAIQSILGQTYWDFEFIIIDDGSTDRSAEIIRSFQDARIVFLQQSNNGLVYSLNRGIQAGEGKYIARMDADDISAPTRLEKQVNFLNQHPEFVLVGSGCNLINEQGSYISTPPTLISREQISRALSLGTSPFVHGSVLFRKKSAIVSGLYDSRMVTFEDWALWKKMFAHGEMTNLDEALYLYRLTPGSITTLPPKQNKRRRTIIRNAVIKGEISESEIFELTSLKSGLKASDFIAAYNLRIGKSLIEDDWRPQAARIYFYKAIINSPKNFPAWLNLFLTFLPKFIVSKWKNSRLELSGKITRY